MTWRSTPATRTPRLEHVAGTVPPRPLEVGDSVTFPDGKARVVIQAAPRLLTFADAAAPAGEWPAGTFYRHREPLEGDLSACISAVEVENAEDDPENYVSVSVCLPCADHDCHTCYGGPCKCACKGERV